MSVSPPASKLLPLKSNSSSQRRPFCTNIGLSAVSPKRKPYAVGSSSVSGRIEHFFGADVTILVSWGSAKRPVPICFVVKGRFPEVNAV